MPRLGVTRNSEQLVPLIRKAIERNIEIIPLPFLSVEPVSFSIPDNHPLSSVDWLIFTSANGVQNFFKQLSSDEKKKFTGKIGVVGFKTEAALLDYGYRADLIPVASYGKELFMALLNEESISEQTVLFARAKEVNFDPKELLGKNCGTYLEMICYESKINNLPPNKVAGFTKTDHILFTAPSTVKAYNAQFEKPHAKPIAIGESTAAAMHSIGWEVSITMDKPDITQVLEYI